jgi:hypothetical protein
MDVMRGAQQRGRARGEGRKVTRRVSAAVLVFFFFHLPPFSYSSKEMKKV